MDNIERVNTVLDFKSPDRLPQCNFFTEGFVRINSGLTKNLYMELGYEIVPLFANIAPKAQSEEKSPGEDGTFTDGWGRLCRTLPNSDYIEVIKHAPFSIETLPKYTWEQPDHNDRVEKPVEGNLHHPRPFAEELADLKGKAFLCGNVYDPFEALGRIIGLKNALITLKTHPDEIKLVLNNIGSYMKELGLAQLKYAGESGLQGIWIWGDIAYTKGLMMSPSTYRELILPPLRSMCDAFKEKNVKIIYHTDGNPREVLPDLIDVGISALHPTEQVEGMILESLLDEFHGKLTFIGGIPPLSQKSPDPEGDLNKALSQIVKLGEQGGVIPGFTSFIHSGVNKKVLNSITNFFEHNHYRQ